MYQARSQKSSKKKSIKSYLLLDSQLKVLSQIEPNNSNMFLKLYGMELFLSPHIWSSIFNLHIVGMIQMHNSASSSSIWILIHNMIIVSTHKCIFSFHKLFSVVISSRHSPLRAAARNIQCAALLWSVLEATGRQFTVQSYWLSEIINSNCQTLT